MSTKAMKLKRACLKTLSAVEAQVERSHQHEFNGVSQLKDLFGDKKLELVGHFSVRGTPIRDDAKVTWYDSRENHPTRSEFRLYFQTNEVMKLAREGDNILLGYDDIGELHLVLIRAGTAGHLASNDGWSEALNVAIE